MDAPRFRPTPIPRARRHRRCARIFLLDASGHSIDAIVRDSSARGMSLAVLGRPPALDAIVRIPLPDRSEVWGLVRWREGNRFGVEFAGTSIASGKDGKDSDAANEQYLAHNPAVKFGNAQRGYVGVQLTREAWTADLRVAEKNTAPGQPLHTRATIRVPAGAPRIEVG